MQEQKPGIKLSNEAQVTLALLAGAVLFCGICPIVAGLAYVKISGRPIPELAPAETSTATTESEYYRGAYDVCTYFYTNTQGGSDIEVTTACNGFVARLRSSGWYDSESKGYEK